MSVKNLMNYIVYGNSKGEPTHKGKSSEKYNDFISEVFTKENDEEYDDGQGRHYDILDEELQ